ncbi:efflux RND transporter permease subunit [candidate division KSB1 bacterium]|nr:efflux RND transporter permease subunit [candidate division KSB1 bacterium]
MKMTQTAIKRGVTFAMIYLIAIGFGLFSLSQLNLDLFPDLDFPMIAVISQYTGVGPFDIETVVTRPIEETVATVENIKKITSTSAQGLSVVMLEFDWGTDMNQAEIDVRNNLQFIEGMMPDDVTEPLVFAFNPSLQPILFLSISSDIHGLAELRRIAENDIEPRLERIPGVASAWTMGGLRREIKILVDPDRMRAHHIAMPQVTAAMQMNNLQLPAGWIDNATQEFTLRAAGEFTSIEQIQNTSVAEYNGSVIRVKDVANVVDGFAEQRQRVWNNDVPSVMLVVQKQSDANTVNVCEGVTSRLEQVKSEVAKGIEIGIVYDQSTFINRSMSNLGNTAFQAILLSFLVLLFFLRDMRSSLIVAATIPVSIIVTFAVMQQAGLTLNIISMAGLALAVGLLVDNSIVVLESIFRHQEEGESLRDSAANGTDEVAMAITASTLTTLSVFLPVLFVPGLAGELFNDMVVTICFSLTVSLFVALTLIPLLASRLLKLKKNLKSNGIFSRMGESIGNGLINLQSLYERSLGWALKYRKTVLLAALLAFALSVIALFSIGGDFLPKNDDGFIALAVDRSPGTSLDEMERSMHQLDGMLRENIPEAENIYTNFGQGEGVMALFSSRASSEGDITVKLASINERKRGKFEIQDSLRKKVAMLPDLEVRFEDRGQTLFSAGGDISVELFGYDLDRAKALANEIKSKVEKIQGVVYTETSIREAAPELKINFDRQRIADLGMSTAQVGQVVSTSILGSVVTRYREGGDEYDIRVQLAEDARESKKDVENIMIMTPTGRQIPLRAVADVEYSKAPTEINREDQERVVRISMNISGRDLRTLTEEVTQVLKTVAIPNDFRVEIGGLAEEQQESFIYLGIAMLAAIILTYMVMASQFESLLNPFIILFTIPLSLIGVALALVVTGTNLNVMALVGVIMLVGIVVNNGIVLVDYINKLRQRGKELFDAIIEAGRVRLRPVLMTALTTILAMLPLALGLGESGENWAPMARSVMGGLTVATMLTLIVVPVIYAVLERFLEKIRARRQARADARQERMMAPERA